MLLPLVALLLTCCQTRTTDIFISTTGSDEQGTGSIEQPFQTLERGRDEIRKLKSEGKERGGFQVYLREGTYARSSAFRLNEQDGGTEKSPVVYSAYNNERVKIHGGIVIPVAEISREVEEMGGWPQNANIGIPGADETMTKYGEILVLPKGANVTIEE